MKFGFMAVTIVVWGMGFVSGVRAEEADVKLPEVVVTATKTEKDPKDVTQSVTVITAEEIKKSSATNAAEAIQMTVGTKVAEQGTPGSLQTISIRGSEYAQVVVLLDGKRLNSPRDGGFDLSALPVALDEIDRIEILRGPASALYGADAVGGVVNIITKKPAAKRTSVSGSVGSNGYDLLSFSNTGKWGDLSYGLTASRETSDGYSPNSDLAQGTVGGRIGLQITPSSILDLTANYIGKEIGTPGSTDTQLHFVAARQWTRNSIAGIGYTLSFSRELNLKLNGTYNRDTLIYKNPDPYDPPPSITTYFADSKHTSETRDGEMQVNWLANSWNAVTVGGEFRSDSLESTDSGNHAVRLLAGYFQDEISFGEPLILLFGGRYDDNSTYGSQFSPKAGGRYLITDTGSIIRASAGRSFRAPTLNDLYWKDSWSQGNPNLSPETAKEYEIGLEQPVGSGNVFKLTAFRRKAKNMIRWNIYIFPMQPENIGRSDIAGLEAEAIIKPVDRLTFAVNYTYLDPENEVTGTKIYGLPKNEIKGSMTLEVPRRTTLYVEGRSLDNYVKPGEDAWQYFVMDAKLSRALRFGAAYTGTVFVSMTNIFDRYYAKARSYMGGHIGDYPMPPREIFGGISVQF